MKSSIVYTSDGRLNTKVQRQKDIKFEMSDSCPDSYKTNTIKEELCLEYIRSFIEQFSAIHTDRKIPYMVAENEMGVKKFVCTTVRPTQLPIPELYDMFECASFTSGFVIYEPLDPPSEYPKYLFSPSLVLDSHTGDSFDIANLLTSFLLGSGYDAYMVCGYAPSFITLKDQSMTRCTLINEGPEPKSKSEPQIVGAGTGTGTGGGGSSSSHGGASSAHGAQDVFNISSNYAPPDNSVKSSKFLADQEETARLAGLDTFQLWIPDADLDESQMMESAKSMEIAQDGKHRRMHAWVLVRAGKRDVKENLFVEPSTGRVYTASNSPYISIESLWNHVNFWVNTTQFETKVSQVGIALSRRFFELWYVLYSNILFFFNLYDFVYMFTCLCADEL
jgi:hypothetical protein